MIDDWQCAVPSPPSVKHLMSPVTVARNCENVMPDSGDVFTSIFCCFGKNWMPDAKSSELVKIWMEYLPGGKNVHHSPVPFWLVACVWKVDACFVIAMVYDCCDNTKPHTLNDATTMSGINGFAMEILMVFSSN